MAKVVVAGHICIDFTPPFLGGGKKGRIEEVLAPGKLLHVGPAYFHPGGVVVNTGLAMKAFGADVTLMGKVGEDPFGRMIRDFLQGQGAEEGLIVDRGSDTSYTVVLAPPGIDRIFLHHPGANDTFSASDIDYAACRGAALFHFGYPPLMRRMHEAGELAGIFRRVKEECRCLTSLDMAAVDEDSEAGRADWERILVETLPWVDFFMPSAEEICFMLDRPLYRDLKRRAAGGDVTGVLSAGEMAPLAERLLGMGCKVALLKCGAAGLYYRTADEDAFDRLRASAGLDLPGFANRQGFERSYVPDAVVSGTGAGDTAIGAFLAALLKGRPFDRCLQLAAAAGACCVASLDALGGLASLEAMEARIDAGWAKQGLEQ